MDYIGAKGGGSNRIWTAGESLDTSILGMAAMGSAIKAQAIGCDVFNLGTNATNISNAVVYFAALYLSKAATLTGACFMQGTQGAYTASTNCKIGLYQISSTNLALLASSAHNGNLFKATASTLVKEPFSSTYAAAAGLYYVGFLWNRSAQTTQPSLYFGTKLNANGLNTLDFTTNVKLSGSLGSQSDLPSSTALSGIGISNDQPWVGVY
jgi:hypothetical protein